MRETADVRTADQERWLGGHLWCGLTSTAFAERGGIPCWDVPITPKKRHTEKVAVKCGRCNGEGAIACFTQRYSGVCFACGGSGFRLISLAAYKRRRTLVTAQKAHSDVLPEVQK
jgi:hypothetical protein